ncbi:DUF2784 domain-containing protein [uncultured Methylibium sp.]|uniref:DUF2784 domain-containing protein n=1 Tax=uncultured Methylibium sp. TaxID=381093 RepID=UPI0025EAF95F|nr:DUF2784 domain-containing protein [uncultured Methylibium sp.]
MNPARLADAVLLLHAGFIAFVVAGGLLGLRWPRALLFHLPAWLWGAYVELSGSLCPLTPLENRLRAEAGQRGYEAGFVEHWLLPLIYPVGLTREWQWLLGAGVIAVNLVVYAGVWRRWRRAS